MERNSRVLVTDTTLRDGHQSLWATRMKLSEMLPIAEKLDAVGYWSLEVWGGATFDVALRYLNEDPWERLKELRKHVKRTRLQMLLRGQNIVGYRNYPDDVLEAFVARSADLGLDVFRVFDALNDARNLTKAIECVKKAGKHAQGTLCYTISPIHTVEYYVARAKEQLELGIDSICIKDMAGILAPETAYELVKALTTELKLPVQLHCHASSGMAIATYLRAIDAGVATIDTAHAPLAFSTSQPAVESVIAMLRDTPADPGLDMEVIASISDYLERIRQERGIVFDRIVDEMVIVHQIPGGMASNLVSQLKEQKALDRLREVLEEVPRVRRDLGYPPLVTPTSQIVGVQAVFNVLAGSRYKVVPREVRDYVKGLYGRSPAPIKEDIRRKILGREKVITERPADLLEPMLEKIRQEVPPDLVMKDEDYLTYALFPEVALKYFNWRKNPEQSGVQTAVNMKEQKVDTPKESDREPGIELVKELLELVAKHDISELEWEHADSKVKICRAPLSPSTSRPAPAERPITEPAPLRIADKPSPGTSRASTQPPIPDVKPAKPQPEEKYEEIRSPMVGTFYLRPRPDATPFVEKGMVVEPGQTLCIIEAMKLMNEIEAEKKCRIVEILVGEGDAVEYGQVLFRVEPL